MPCALLEGVAKRSGHLPPSLCNALENEQYGEIATGCAKLVVPTIQLVSRLELGRRKEAAPSNRVKDDEDLCNLNNFVADDRPSPGFGEDGPVVTS